ncbi:hypothetical protein VTL71DRAFT_807 [Oculimacula yallundae]|uniref:Uncharacterized protein n=1 Tax=Oculimacula yallundae TaxID=86028 RepID=A0ABR4D148_9HELO
MQVTSTQISQDAALGLSTEAPKSAVSEYTSLVQDASSINEDTAIHITPLTSNQENSPPGEPPHSHSTLITDRPLVLYSYASSKDGTALENLKFFIAHGLHAAADFIFILNGKSSVASLIPKEDNIRVVQRKNTCYDLGAFAEVLLKGDLYKQYKRFITMNASIRGPFVPYWSNGCWTDMFLDKITKEVKLVGITANCWPTFHIQSMIWATDIIGITTLLFPPRRALLYLTANPVHLPLKNKARALAPSITFGINGCFSTYSAAIAAEITSTSLILASGYKVDAMMLAYHGLPTYHEEQKTCENNKDVFWKDDYFGIDVHPFETVFMKSNRDVSPLVLERGQLSTWAYGLLVLRTSLAIGSRILISGLEMMQRSNKDLEAGGEGRYSNDDSKNSNYGDKD